MTYFDFYSWLAYFGMGLVLLATLVWARAALGRRKARRAKVDATMARARPSRDTTVDWQPQGSRGIR